MIKINKTKKNPLFKAESCFLEMSRIVTREELRANNTEDSCWVSIRSKVYHIPKGFIFNDHPGGSIIMEGAGRDATELFEVACSHSEHAKEVLEDFRVGNLEKEVVVVPTKDVDDLTASLAVFK